MCSYHAPNRLTQMWTGGRIADRSCYGPNKLTMSLNGIDLKRATLRRWYRRETAA